MNSSTPKASALVTLADVGRKAGVSAATASLALRGSPKISASTRGRVVAAAESLHYRPDPVLAALVARRRQARNPANLGVVIDARWRSRRGPWATWLRTVRKAMGAKCEQFGYSLIELDLLKDICDCHSPDRLLDARGIRGLIMLPYLGDARPLGLDWNRYAWVALGSPPHEIPLHRVRINAFAAMELVLGQLRARGLFRIGLAQHFDAERRLRFQWLGALAKEAWIPHSLVRMTPPFLPPEMTPLTFLEWFRREEPQAIITHDTRILDWLADAGISIPGQVSVILLDWELSGRPKAAGISTHLELVAETAVELAHSLLLRGEVGIPTVNREVLISAHWVEGDTVQPLRGI